MPITFFNADRTASATIVRDEFGDVDGFCFSPELGAACTVLLSSGLLDGFFDGRAHVVKDLRQVAAGIDKAHRAGDLVFSIEVDKNPKYAVRIKPCSEPSSRFHGFIIVKAREWKERCSPLFTQAFVALHMEVLARWITAWCNHEVYEIVHDGGISGPYLNEEEALKDLKSEFPDLLFADADFNCINTNTPRPDALA